jgi:hypothetical protein
MVCLMDFNGTGQGRAIWFHKMTINQANNFISCVKGGVVMLSFCVLKPHGYKVWQLPKLINKHNPNKVCQMCRDEFMWFHLFVCLFLSCLPSGNFHIAMENGQFIDVFLPSKKKWFSIAMLNCQMVTMLRFFESDLTTNKYKTSPEAAFCVLHLD